MFVFILFFGIYSSAGCFELDSITQQKALELQKEILEPRREDSIPHGA
jgi:hypothetical protein